MTEPLSVLVERASEPTEDVRALVRALEHELAQHYTPEQRHGLALDAIFQPHIRFYVAMVEGKAVGCGGVGLFSDFAELKRMFVQSAARGRGIADAILARLAAEAWDSDKTLLRLETGTRQAAAIRFYERNGFQRCEAFPPYSSMTAHAIATSVFLEKRLTSPILDPP